MLTAGESFRRPQWHEVVKWGEPEAHLELEAEGDGRCLDINLRVTQAGRRAYRVNGKARRRVSEASGIIPSVVFTPDDLRMVKDSADRRRAAIDSVGDQLSASYLAARMEYERIVRQRNAALKDIDGDQATLAVLAEKLVTSGSAFCGHRKRLFERISSKMSEVYGTLTENEPLTARYVPSWERNGADTETGDMAEAMNVALTAVVKEEAARGLTLIGPHRDEVEFKVGGRDARAYASQGQTRTIALAWKLAEVGVISEIAGQTPLLLLDDVMSELDEARRHALAEAVGGIAQTVVTTTNLGYFEKSLVDRARVVAIP